MKLYAALAVVALLGDVPAGGVEIAGSTITLSPEQVQACTDGGGCVFMSKAQLADAIEAAARRLNQKCWRDET